MQNAVGDFCRVGSQPCGAQKRYFRPVCFCNLRDFWRVSIYDYTVHKTKIIGLLNGVRNERLTRELFDVLAWYALTPRARGDNAEHLGFSHDEHYNTNYRIWLPILITGRTRPKTPRCPGRNLNVFL